MTTPTNPAQTAQRDQADAFDRELEELAECPDCRSVVIAHSKIEGNERHVTILTWHSTGCPNKAGQLERPPREMA
jgi:hypothetical protein